MSRESFGVAIITLCRVIGYHSMVRRWTKSLPRECHQALVAAAVEEFRRDIEARASQERPCQFSSQSSVEEIEMQELIATTYASEARAFTEGCFRPAFDFKTTETLNELLEIHNDRCEVVMLFSVFESLVQIALGDLIEAGKINLKKVPLNWPARLHELAGVGIKLPLPYQDEEIKAERANPDYREGLTGIREILRNPITHHLLDMLKDPANHTITRTDQRILRKKLLEMSWLLIAEARAKYPEVFASEPYQKRG